METISKSPQNMYGELLWRGERRCMSWSQRACPDVFMFLSRGKYACCTGNCMRMRDIIRNADGSKSVSQWTFHILHIISHFVDCSTRCACAGLHILDPCTRQQFRSWVTRDQHASVHVSRSGKDDDTTMTGTSVLTDATDSDHFDSFQYMDPSSDSTELTRHHDLMAMW